MYNRGMYIILQYKNNKNKQNNVPMDSLFLDYSL